MTDSAINFTITDHEAEAWTAGRWCGDQRTVTIQGAAIDSRQVADGFLFACFKGEHVDGHDFAANAVERGAALVLAERELDLAVPVLVVADVTAAFGAMAAAYRGQYQDAVWIGVTGSNGKTTVKELLSTACSAIGPVRATQGNLNNHLGVPLTVLNTPSDCAVVIIEMGASAVGEIAALAQIAQPDIGVITSIGPAHLEGFGSLLGVATGKTELFQAVAPDGRMLFGRHGLESVCADYGVTTDAVLRIVRETAQHGHLTVIGGTGCSVDGECHERGSILRTPVGEVGIRLVGEHNLANAALAWHTAVAAGADPQAALGRLATVPPAAGRLDVRTIGLHRLFDDAYNANPASMAAGLGVLSHQHGARLAVLGGMGELGEDSEQQHAHVGALAARLGLPLITVGKAGKAIGEGYEAAGGRDHVHARTHDEAIDLILGRMKQVTLSILVKASRSARLDRVVGGILDRLGYASGSQHTLAKESLC